MVYWGEIPPMSVSAKIHTTIALTIGSLLTSWSDIQAHAASIPLPAFPGFASIATQDGNSSLKRFIESRMIPVFRIVFSAIAVFYIIYYGALLVFNFGKDSDIKSYRMALFYAVLGLLIMNLGYPFNLAFNPNDNKGEIDLGATNRLAGGVIDFMRLIVVPVAIALLVISGYRLAVNAGKEGNAAKYRMQVLYTILGLVIINMAESVILAVTSDSTAQGFSLLASVTNFVLLFVVPIGFAVLIYGGLSMLFSLGNQARYDKGLKVVKGTAIAMVLIYSSFTLVTELAKWIQF